MSDVLEISDLSVTLDQGAARPILDGVSLTVAAGDFVALVGESGSGKSVTSRAALGLWPGQATVSGSVRSCGVEMVGASASDLDRVRRGQVGMVFQDPRAGINPVRRIGDFLTEGPQLALGWSAERANARALELLEAVSLPDPKRHLRQYPHELSGGMLQRVMIASALMTQPALLLCDEATTALDVTTQAEIVGILTTLCVDLGTAVLFVTHDLDLAAATCDRIAVMYAGQVVESGRAEDLFEDPHHPYTVGLLDSRPPLGGLAPDTDLQAIPGTPLSLAESPAGCRFATRCQARTPQCETRPGLLADGVQRLVRCWHPSGSTPASTPSGARS